MKLDLTTFVGAVSLGDIELPVLASGRPRVIGDYEVLLPSGPVTLVHPFSDSEFYRHGWNSWSPSGWRRLEQAPLRIYGSKQRLLTADDARNDTPQAHSGSAVGAITLPGGEIILLGALGLGAPRVGATSSTLWGTVERAGAQWYLARGPEREVFAQYARKLAEHLGTRDTHPGRVWSSWYSFYEDIDEARLRGVIADLSDMPVDVIQIDDGWEREVGDWQANSAFPGGMARMASTITSTSRRAGLWLAPLIATPQSDFARAHPDLLVSNPDGRPLVAGYNWGGEFYALDTTHPDVVAHLTELFTRVVDWGFSYLKLDFMYAGALDGLRHREVHREEAYRDALTLIRTTVGEDVYLLGCGVPIVPSLGIVDGVRVGPDVAAFWDNAERPGDPTGVGARNALASSLNRAWLRQIVQVDPDVVYFRRRRSLLDDAQRQMLEDLATIADFKSTSDPIAWLDAHETAMLRDWLQRRDHVTQLSRYVYRINERVVDFEPFVVGYRAPVSTVAG